MNERELREAICEIGRRCWQRRHVSATDGNISARLDDRRVLATPTRMSKGDLKPSDLVVVDLEGNQLAGARRMTSEIKMHLNCYRRREDVRACVHTHAPAATAFAIAQRPVPKCVMPEAEVFLGEIPIVPYANPGTQEFGAVLDPFLADFDVFLLASHGVLTIGHDLTDAYHKTETVEHYCEILLHVRALGGPAEIPSERMEQLFETKRSLGLHDRRLQPGGSTACDLPSPAPLPTGEPGEQACLCGLEGVIEEIASEVLQGLRPEDPR